MNISGVENWLYVQKFNPGYQALLKQLQKDFDRSNVNLVLTEDMSPNNLLQLVKEVVYKLLLEDFEAYLRLMYLIDVSENKFKKMQVTDAVEVAAQSTLWILEREIKKIVIRERYSS